MYKLYTRTTPAKKIDPYLTNKYCTEDELYFAQKSVKIFRTKIVALCLSSAVRISITAIVQLKQRFNLESLFTIFWTSFHHKELEILLQQAFPTFSKGFLY
ncbi:hypothetical protein GHT06_019036 [Daphnia sinensis]|uniref:Uncharacterized protein n=1 Tax=Daphnia sinensis TaxID=1820382 RepID=A0AAD5PNX0_9CRUS|nr:hypothetical protein GHT06_019036 [Daphnia sinensis]